MTGTPAERRLLGSLLLDKKQARAIHGTVAGDDFSDARLGQAFDRLTDLIAQGGSADQVTIDGNLASWGVRGLPVGVGFEWTEGVFGYQAPEYAQLVRSDSIRRTVRNLTQATEAALRDGEAPLDAASRLQQSLSAAIDGAATGMLRTKTLEEILQGSDSYDWVVPGLLERKDRLVLTGAEGAGKTTFVRQLAVLSSAGVHPTTFERIEPVKVLVVDSENTERQWRRAVRWMTSRAREVGAVDPAKTINIVAGNRIDITKGSHLSEIHRLIDMHNPDALFIGPLYKLVPKAINNDDDAAPLIVGLDSLRERDVALVMEAHAGKGSSSDGERDLRPRGSAALLGWPEFGMGLRPVPEDPDMVAVVRWRGDRDERAWPKHMVRNGNWPWTPVSYGGAY